MNLSGLNFHGSSQYLKTRGLVEDEVHICHLYTLNKNLVKESVRKIIVMRPNRVRKKCSYYLIAVFPITFLGIQAFVLSENQDNDFEVWGEIGAGTE